MEVSGQFHSGEIQHPGSSAEADPVDAAGTDFADAGLLFVHGFPADHREREKGDRGPEKQGRERTAGFWQLFSGEPDPGADSSFAGPAAGNVSLQYSGRLQWIPGVCPEDGTAHPPVSESLSVFPVGGSFVHADDADPGLLCFQDQYCPV